jgi:hypothetical protein
VIRRFDVGVVDSLDWQETPTGGMRARARLTRTGVFRYVLQDGTARLEYRPPEEVFAPESVASMRGAAVTDLHPEDFVNAENWATLSKGVVTDDVAANETSGAIEGSILVQTKDMLDLVKSGRRREVSMGYSALWDPTPGTTPEGVRYDGVQRTIRYNHAGLGPDGWGRQGPTVSLLRKTDGACIPESQAPMAKHKIDGIEYEAGSEAHIQAVDKAIGNAAEAIAKANKRADDAAAELAATKKRADTAEAASKPDAIAKRVAFRADLLSKARATLGAEYLKDEEAAVATDDDTIIRDILKSVAPSVDTSGMDHLQLMTALRVVFAMTVGTSTSDPAASDTPPPPAGGSPPPPAPAGDSITKVRGAPAPRTDAKPPLTIAQAQAEAQQRAADRWKGN